MSAALKGDMAPTVIAIAAMDEMRVIGCDNRIPWHLPEDMRHFAELTTGHTVLMGRRTYDSLPERFRPLPRRTNIVASRGGAAGAIAAGVEVCPDAAAFVEAFKGGIRRLSSDLLWIIGGAGIYQATEPWWDEVRLTLVRGAHDGDAFFPPFEQGFSLVGQTEGELCSFLHYRRVRA